MSGWETLTEATLGAAMVVMGTPFTFIPASTKVPQEHVGVFDAEFAEEVPDVGGDITIAMHNPMIGIRLSDFTPEPEQGDTIQRKGIAYDIKHIEPDGQGGTRLILHEQRDIC